MGTAPNYAQIAPDSLGKKVATGEFTLVKPDGSQHTVEAQTVMLCDADGNIINPSIIPLFEVMHEVLSELQEMKAYLAEMLMADTKWALKKKANRHISFSDKERSNGGH